MEKKGRLLVLDGLDGSGKATQTALLLKVLEERGETVRKVSFPDYASDSSALIKMYLSGAFGTDPEAVNPYAASSFYAVDRYASFQKDWRSFYEAGGLVLADRYTTSNAIHQCAKLPRGEWDGFLDWLFHYEYTLLGIPAPDAVLWLSVDPTTSQRLMTERYHGDESKKDIHEKNLRYLEHSRAAAAYCGEKLGWERIDCAQNGTLRSVEEIGKEILRRVEALGLIRAGDRGRD